MYTAGLKSTFPHRATRKIESADGQSSKSFFAATVTGETFNDQEEREAEDVANENTPAAIAEYTSALVNESEGVNLKIFLRICTSTTKLKNFFKKVGAFRLDEYPLFKVCIAKRAPETRREDSVS